MTRLFNTLSVAATIEQQEFGSRLSQRKIRLGSSAKEFSRDMTITKMKMMDKSRKKMGSEYLLMKVSRLSFEDPQCLLMVNCLFFQQDNGKELQKALLNFVHFCIEKILSTNQL